MEEKFDYENEPIIIPPDAEPDINNDWVLEEDQEAELVNAFSAAKEAAWAPGLNAWSIVHQSLKDIS